MLSDLLYSLKDAFIDLSDIPLEVEDLKRGPR